MKTRTIKHLAASALVLGMLATVQTATAASQGIVNTRHNLGSGTLAPGATSGNRSIPGNSGLGDVFTTGTDQICVFCHTPHGANTGVTSAPLWNRATGSATYTVYTSGTMQATAPGNTLNGGASLACLSCHDGTQAMDNMLNQPGQGGFNRDVYSNGSRLGGQIYATGYKLNSGSSAIPGAVITGTGQDAGAAIWFSGGTKNIVSSTGAGAYADPLPTGWSNPAGDVADTVNGHLGAAAGVDFLGTDMKDDHPVGISYAGCNGGTTCDPDFKAATAGLGGMFQVGGTTPGDKTAMRLYGATLASATVECASCHDPHTDDQPTFLRKSNAGSAVCLTCHTK